MAETYEPVPLIRKQIAGTISIPEKTWLEAWAKESKDNRALLEHYKDPAVIRADVQSMAGMNEERMDQQFTREFRQLTHPDYVPVHQLPARKTMLRSLAVAALIAALALGVHLLWPQAMNRLEARPVTLQQLLQEMSKQVTVAQLIYKGDSVRYIDDTRPEERLARVGNWLITKRDRRFLAIADIDTTALDNKTADNAIFSIPDGEIWQVLLPDNSKIFLEPGSSLSLLRRRTVALEGSATIDVSEDRNNPFQLVSKRLQTTVTGTLFTVRDYNKEGTALAILHRGKLIVDNGRDSLLLKPNDEAVVSRGRDKIRLMTDTTSGETPRWQSSYFDFSHERLPTSIKRVMAWYDLKRYQIKAGVDTLTLGKLRTGPVGKDLTLNEFLQEVQAPDLHIWVSTDKTTLIVDKDVTK